MAYTITSEKYPPRKPIVTVEADSLDDVAELNNVAEGSTANIGGKEYSFDSNSGWIAPGSGGSGGGGTGGGALIVNLTTTDEEVFTFDKTVQEIQSAIALGAIVYVKQPDTDYYKDSYGIVSSIQGNIDYDTQEVESYNVFVYSGSNQEQYQAMAATNWYPQISYA